jgi:hypothetical protein
MSPYLKVIICYVACIMLDVALWFVIASFVGYVITIALFTISILSNYINRKTTEFFNSIDSEKSSDI